MSDGLAPLPEFTRRRSVTDDAAKPMIQGRLFRARSKSLPTPVECKQLSGNPAISKELSRLLARATQESINQQAETRRRMLSTQDYHLPSDIVIGKYRPAQL
jgi:hypothetical protein